MSALPLLPACASTRSPAHSHARPPYETDPPSVVLVGQHRTPHAPAELPHALGCYPRPGGSRDRAAHLLCPRTRPKTQRLDTALSGRPSSARRVRVALQGRRRTPHTRSARAAPFARAATPGWAAHGLRSPRARAGTRSCGGTSPYPPRAGSRRGVTSTACATCSSRRARCRYSPRSLAANRRTGKAPSKANQAH